MATLKETSRAASACALIRSGTDEKTGETLTTAAVTERVSWCAAIVSVTTVAVIEAHWNTEDITKLTSREGPDGRPLPAQSWMALRRLGWAAAAPIGVVANDRIMRMAQEQAGRTLRSAAWRASLTAGIIATWPTEPGKRTETEWDAVRSAVPGGSQVTSGVIRARTRQVQRYLAASGRMPRDLFDLESAPRAAPVLLLSACDRQQATLQRHETDPRRALLRVQLPVRPDPRSYRDWTWVAIPLLLPPTVPAAAQLHLPDLRVAAGKARAEITFTQVVPAARRDGHTVAIGVDWGLNTMLSAGPVLQGRDGVIAALGHGAQYRASGVLAKTRRLRRQAEQLHAKISHYERLTTGNLDPPSPPGWKSCGTRPGTSPNGERTSTTPSRLRLPGGLWTRPSPSVPP